MVIPAMDHIDEILTTNAVNKISFKPCIRVAATLAKKTLNRYYDMTDHSEVYRIAMSTYFTSFGNLYYIKQVCSPSSSSQT